MLNVKKHYTVIFESGTRGIQGPPGNLALELHYVCITFLCNLDFYSLSLLYMKI